MKKTSTKSDSCVARRTKVAKLEQGRIVRVEVGDPQGRNLKKRPVVIVHPTNEIKPGESIVCVAITAEVAKIAPADCILLPYHPNRHPRTGLSKRCAAMCSWVLEITEDQIIEFMGIVPKSKMDAILALLAKLD